MNSFLKKSLSLICFFAFSAFAQETPLDKSLAPVDDDSYSNVFKDMGVVQRRAMKKSGKFLISIQHL